ncbi:hypothetical protein JCM6882_001401 [Rhodosporidiobolus microsporus]
MNKAARGGGFFDDDDDDAPESYQTTTTAGALAGDDTLSSNYGASVSPQRNWPDAGQRDSSVGTGSRAGGRVSSVTGAAAGSSVRGFESSRGDSPSLDDILGEGRKADEGRNVQKLLRAWQNEMGAPELLKFPRELVERVVKTLAKRKEMVRIAKETEGQDDSFYVALGIVATENMRVSHVLKMFTRERIWKLEQCAEYYLQQDDVHERLYGNEIAHAEGFVRLVKAYHDSAAMDAMPEQVTRNPPPIPQPDFSKPVFFRARRDCQPVVLPDGEIFAFEKGSQHMCRYSTVRALLENGDVELI